MVSYWKQGLFFLRIFYKKLQIANKLSLREIARRTGFSRNTGRRYLRDEISEPVYSKRQTPGKLDFFADNLRQWLGDAARTSRK